MVSAAEAGGRCAGRPSGGSGQGQGGSGRDPRGRGALHLVAASGFGQDGVQLALWADDPEYRGRSHFRKRPRFVLGSALCDRVVTVLRVFVGGSVFGGCAVG